MAANVNNYAKAGNAAVRKAVLARKALAENKPRYDEIAMQAVTEAAKDTANIAENNSKTAQMKMNAEAAVERVNIKGDADKYEQGQYKKARMTGLLAGGAALLGGSVAYKNKKDEPNEQLALIQQQLGTYQKRVADMTAKLTDIDNETYPGSGVKPTSSTDLTGDKPDQGTPVSTDVSAQQAANPSGAMSKQAIKDLAISQGFSAEDAAVVVGIAGGESGYDPSNSTRRSGLYAKTGEDSVGLMQINWGYHKDNGWLQGLGINSREDLLDPAKNMKAAKYLYDGRGGFGDWTVYNKGIYRDKM